MIRGTTAQFKFKLPYKFESLDLVTITFWQPGNNDACLPIIKYKSDCSKSDTDSCCLCVSLTEGETFRFSDKYKARVQLKATHTNGTVFASRQQLINVYPINDEMIDVEMPKPKEENLVILDGKQISS